MRLAGDLEKRLADAVQAIAATPVGEETKTFLDVEDAGAVTGLVREQVHRSEEKHPVRGSLLGTFVVI